LLGPHRAIGTLTQVVLRKGFPYLHKLRYFKSKMSGREGAKFHEAGLTEGALDKVWRRLDVPDVPELFPRRDWELWAAAAFDRAILCNKYNGVHRWLLRRWTAFNIATTSFVGLFLSIIVGLVIVAAFGFGKMPPDFMPPDYWHPFLVVCSG
jgi:hypothetical protein